MSQNLSTSNTKKNHYRPDIDGLRALAVIPVIFFHLKISGFSGGFIGVDIFFVISGYLITSIIVRELNEEKFSLIRFWERRVRRILPVLFFVLIVTTLASYFITLFPPDFSKYGQSLAAQGLFIVNIFFMRIGDYFAAPAETITLLHTWSLAVEEQFYILFPILLLVIFKVSKKFLLPTLISIGILSLVYSLYLVNINPTDPFSVPFIPHVWGGATNANAGFYFPVARAWELIAGALLAVSAWRIKNNHAAEAISLLGVAAIIFTIVFLTDKSAFPGVVALAPVLGTLAIIIGNTGHKTLVSKILSFPALVWIGLISYSLYLWHWPMIVLTGQYLNTTISPNINGLIFVATFVLSIGSYFFVETPFRKKQILGKPWQIFCFGLVATAAIVATGVYIAAKDGLPDRAPAAARAISVATADTNPREYECFKNNYRQIFGEVKPCIIGDEALDIEPTFILWGDSHSNSIMPAFEKVAQDKGVTGVFFAVGGCPPLILDDLLNKDLQCQTHNLKTLDYIKDNNIKKVFVVSSWKGTYEHTNNTGSHTIYDALVETVNKIPDSVQVIIMHRIPKQDEFNVREFFYSAVKTKQTSYLSAEKSDYLNEIKESKIAIERTSTERGNVSSIDPVNIFCLEDKCPLTHGGKIVYSDRNHLNATGALMTTPLLVPFFE